MGFQFKDRKFPLLASAISLTLVGGAAHAQQAAPAATDDVETVVVSGYRESLQQALAIKRDQTGIVEAITADDIADFPDLNLAESLQRVPGVQIDRDGGEGRSINVRGLSSDFVRVQLNGMEALATTGGRDGRANRNRQFDLNVFASELFRSVTVTKSQSANQDEGSLGATVGLTTAKPFDYSGFVMAAGAQLSYNDLAKHKDPRATFLISNRWMDGRLGALFSVAYSTRNTFEEGLSTGRFRVPADDGCVPTTVAGVITSYVNTTRCYQSVGTVTDASGTVLTGLAAQQAAFNAAHPRIPRYGRIGYDRERIGATASFQFETEGGTRFTLDNLYAKLSQTRSEEFLEVISFARETGAQGFRTVDLVSGRVDNNHTLVAATFNDVDVRSEQRIDILSTEFRQHTLNMTHEFSDNLKLEAQVGTSRADGRNPQQTTLSLERYDVDGYSYDFSNPHNPAFNYVFDVKNPANWSYSSSTALGDASLIRLRPNQTLNTYDNGKFDLEWKVNDTYRLSGGVNYKKFGFDVKEWRRTSEGVPASVITLLTASGISQSAYTQLLSGFGSGMSLPAGTDTAWVVPSIARLNSIIQFDCNCINQAGDFRLTRFDGETRSATEKSLGGYLQLDWNTELGGMAFRGNLGARYVETKLDSTGILSGAVTKVNNKYHDFLPALNVSLEPIEDLVVRFAAAKTMARPSLSSLTPGGSIDASPPGLSLNTGNPFLAPIRSNNYDVSVEWYPYDEALFAVALFRKDVKSFTQKLIQTVPYSQTGFPDSLLSAGVTPADLFQVTSFVNTDGGPLKGFEVTLQTPFNFLPEALRGFGTQLSFSRITSKFEYITNPTTLTTVVQPLIGQSPKSFSATLYYERGPFEARVSASYRDEYLQVVPAQSGNDVEGKAASTNIDFSASWKFSKQLEVTFEGINLTDEYDNRWINSVRKNPLNYEHTGREFVIGARYKF
jgi:TonB-dependent receptor